MRRVRLIPLFLLVLAPYRGLAQWQLTGDLGYTRLRQADIPESNATTFGAGLEAIGDRGWFRSSLLAAHTLNNGWTGQGVAVGALVGPATRFASWELSASLSGFDQTGASASNSAELMARVHVGRSRFGSAIGLGGGRVNQQGSSSGLAHVQADLWRIAGNHRFMGTVSYVDSPMRLSFLQASSMRASYTDISAGWRYEIAGFSVGAAGGGRTRASNYWASADATVWFAPQSALVFAVGRSLEDPTRGLPQTRYASVAIRLAARPHLTLWSKRERSDGPTIVASREGIEVRVASAKSVEVMGDFTDWLPVSLTNEGKVWRLSRTISPGLHRIALRIDGGTWTTPVNLPRETDDDLGGVVAIITVP